MPPLLLASAVVMISSSACCSRVSRSLVSEIQQVNQRHNKHPDQIHEVPVKPQNLDIIRIVAAAPVAHAHNKQSDHTARNVRKMQARDAEKRCPEQSISPRILEKRHALMNEPHPFEAIQPRHKYAQRS